MTASSSQAIYSTDLNDLYPINFETVCDNPFKYSCLQSEESDISFHFKADYKIIGDKIIELPYVITSEIETISSLIDLGNILLNAIPVNEFLCSFFFC